MDVISDVLGAMRLTGSLYFSTRFTPPWGVTVPAYRRVVRFHLVLRGGLWVGVGGHEPQRLEEGDLVLIPHGAEHWLADRPGRECRVVEELVREVGYAGRGDFRLGDADSRHPTRLLCGHFQFDESIEHPLVAQLPDHLVVGPSDEGVPPVLDGLLRLVAAEVGADRPGRDAVLRRLSEILFVEVLRRWAARGAPGCGLLAGVADPGLHRALGAIHRDPSAPWTLDRLAREAGHSRSAFAARFRERLGETPGRYLLRWRMQRACERLRDPGATVEVVAAEVGYRSLPAFTRAFRRWAGTTPGRWRRVNRAPVG